MTLAASQNLLSNGMTLERWAALWSRPFPMTISRSCCRKRTGGLGAHSWCRNCLSRKPDVRRLSDLKRDLWVNACEMSLANNSNL
ncbi:hypothetical protein Bealeia1_02005 (plasmid) [Candidatus Bealeia paramacronuclearis]|uniref:Uncharacterized protein n=1 Tax=Candidatus Bealeia paramacronuclearis TaxID=1921001 RepID=A0ABZ2C8W8_9PROT